MTSIDTFNLVAGTASVVALAFALFQHHKSRLQRSREEGNIRLFEERLRNVDTSLRAAATSLQILIRRGDSPETPVAELQNLARAVRASVYGAIMEGRGLTGRLKSWKFGELLGSDPQDEVELPENNEEDVTTEAKRP